MGWERKQQSEKEKVRTRKRERRKEKQQQRSLALSLSRSLALSPFFKRQSTDSVRLQNTKIRSLAAGTKDGRRSWEEARSGQGEKREEKRTWFTLSVSSGPSA